MSNTVRYQEHGLDLACRLENEQAWVTIAQLAELFGIDRRTIERHIENILSDGELPKATSTEFVEVRSEGNRSVNRRVRHVNQEMALHVGYRVRSDRGADFRRWATAVIKGEAPSLAGCPEQHNDLLLGTIEALALVRRDQLADRERVQALEQHANGQDQQLDNQERRLQLLEASSKSDPPPPDYMTVSEWCRRHRRRLSDRNLCRLGSRSKQVCDRNGWPSHRVSGTGRFREVGSYPARAIAAAYTELWPERQLPLEIAP